MRCDLRMGGSGSRDGRSAVRGLLRYVPVRQDCPNRARDPVAEPRRDACRPPSTKAAKATVLTSRQGCDEGRASRRNRMRLPSLD